MPESTGTPLLWGGFTLFVLVVLALDLGLFHRKAHKVGMREALLWSAAWVALALAFNVWVYLRHGGERGLEFISGYVVEKSLSVDNLFVIAVVFRAFAVPSTFQHRILFWGILGALVLRGAFIWAGAALIERFDWILYLFGAFLVVTGVRILLPHKVQPDPRKHWALRIFRKLVRTTDEYEGARFLVRKNGLFYATPLLLVLVVIEATDIVFAVDSIPAIFGLTRDPFIVYTSNIFAILGLRSLFFLLAGMIESFAYLKYGLGLVLIFVGTKMLGESAVHIPIWISLMVILFLVGGSVGLSLVKLRRERVVLEIARRKGE